MSTYVELLKQSHQDQEWNTPACNFTANRLQTLKSQIWKKVVQNDLQNDSETEL